MNRYLVALTFLRALGLKLVDVKDLGINREISWLFPNIVCILILSSLQRPWGD